MKKQRYFVHQDERLWLLRFVVAVVAIIIGYWAILNFVRLFSDRMSIQYKEIDASAHDGKIFGLYVEAEKTERFFVLIGEVGKPLGDLTPEDFAALGFVKDNFGYIKDPTSPHICLATLGHTGELRSLSLSHHASEGIRFSSSKEGPFLDLPVKRWEFEKQFGKPTSVEYIYPRGWDPR